MKSLKERFEEDYAAVRVPAENRNGFKIEYVYYAPWYIWNLPSNALSIKKKFLTGMSLTAFLMFLLSAAGYSALNRYIPFNICTAFILCAFVIELPALFRFSVTKYRTTRMNYSSMDKGIRAGSLLQLLFCSWGVVTGLSYIARYDFENRDLLVLTGFLLCAAAGAIIFYEYSRIPVITEKNSEMDNDRTFL